MELPIKYPNDYDVIAGDTARFRALSARQQVDELSEAVGNYYFQRTMSGMAARIDRVAEAEEEASRRAIREFAIRHG